MSIVAALESLKSKHILVTGGAGFIGSNFIWYVLNQQKNTKEYHQENDRATEKRYGAILDGPI